VQQVLSPVGARQQAASAAGCLLCSKSGSTSNSIPISITRRCTPPCWLHLRSNAFVQQRNSPHSHSAAFAALHCQVPHTSPEGLRLHNTPHRQTPEHFQQSASAPDCTTIAAACIRSQMKLSTCPAPHSSPGGLRLCSKCFRPLVQGNSLPPKSVAFGAASLPPQPAAFTAHHRCSAHQPCRASLPLQCFARLGTATTRIRCWLLSLQGSSLHTHSAAPGAASLHAQPAAPSVHAIIQRCIPLFGLHLRNMPDRQPPEHSN